MCVCVGGGGGGVTRVICREMTVDLLLTVAEKCLLK